MKRAANPRRCCRTCKHCELHILRGYECVANPNLFPIPLDTPGDLDRDRTKCRAYKRG